MKYNYDLICIGLGPAGMAVSIMGSEMGLKVCAIEKNKIGGECMNVGCIPSKALLRMAKARNIFDKLDKMELVDVQKPAVKNPFDRIAGYINLINTTKTTKMFSKVDLVLAQGDAHFINAHTIKVGEKIVTAKRIFIATGTEPMIPSIPGIDAIDDILINSNVFNLKDIPTSMTIIGGGAIGCEMAQAFTRLGCKCTIVQMNEHLIPIGDPHAAAIIEKVFIDEKIDVHNSKKISRIEKKGNDILLYTEDGIVVASQSLFVGAGRRINLSSLKLENAEIEYDHRGIKVNRYLQTSQKHIYAVGDCNGKFLLTHAAMHQGMIALMNTMMPLGMKQKFDNFVVPWTVFTDPPVSCVGMTEEQLKKKNIKYETITANYEDYGAAIAEDIGIGFVKVFASKLGRIYGASIVGEGSGEMINEWALAIQKKIRLHDIMLLQHSFPTMGFLTKRIAEMWMMNHMKSECIKSLCRWMFRL